MKALLGLSFTVALPIALGLGAGFAGASVLLPAKTDAPSAPRAKDVALDALPTDGAVVPLEPIITDLAGPAGLRIRLEMAVVFSGTPSRSVAEAIHADALAYLRATTPAEIGTPSGYLFVRADLARRARDLSNGLATDVLVRTFLVE